MSAESHPRVAEARRIGEDVQDLVVDTIDAARPVPDGAAEWHDAVAVSLIDGGDGVLLGSTPLVERGTELEIKAAREVTSNGPGKTTPGRWYFRREQHERLVEAAATYALAVYRDGLARRLVAVILVPASIVEEILAGRWYDSGCEDGAVAKLGWTSILDEDDLEDPEVDA